MALHPSFNLRMPYHRLWRLVLCGLALSSPLAAVAAGALGSPPFRVYTPPSTESEECIRVTFDHRGMMLVINGGDVWEFDGHRWKGIPVARGRLSLAILASQHAPRVYLTGYRDLGYLEAAPNGQHTYVDLRPSLPPEMEKDVIYVHPIEDGQGTFYVGNLWKFCRLAQPGRPAMVWPVKGVLSRLFLHRGKIHGSTNEEGIFFIDGDARRPVDFPERGQSSVSFASATNDGRTLLTLDDGRLAILENERVRILPTQGWGLTSDNYIIGLVTLPNGWFAGNTADGGVVVFDIRGRLHRHTSAEQDFRIVRDSIPVVDRNGQLWVGSSQGVVQIDVLSPISVLDRRHKLGNAIQSFLVSGDQIWVNEYTRLKYADTTGGVSNTQFRVLESVRIIESNLIEVEGRILLNSSRYSGVESRNPNLIELDPKTHQLRTCGPGGTYIMRCQLDPAKIMIVGLDSVIRYRITEQGIEQVGAPIPTPYRVNEIYEGSDNEFWLTVGVDSVARLSFSAEGEAVWTRYGLEHGLPRDWIAPRNIGGELIFCTKVGVYRFDRETQRFSPHPSFSDLPADISAEFLQIQADSRGNLWFASRSGTGVMRRQTDGSYFWDLLGLRMLGKPLVSQMQFEDPDVVWMCTKENIIRYDDRNQFRAQGKYQTLIREVRSVNRSTIHYGGVADLPQSLKIPYADHYLRLQLATTSYLDPKRTEYSHRIRERDDAWSPWTSEPSLDVADLWEGNYTLEVRSQNVFGQAGEPASLGLHILPPWYRTWWAYGLGGVSALSLVLLVGQLRSGYLRRKNLALQRLVDESTEQIRHQAEELATANASMARANEELRDTNDELATTNHRLIDANHRLEEMDREKNEFIGIVSHDLRNPLGAISQASELLGEEPTLSEQGQELVGLVRQSADMSLGIVTNLLDLNRIEQGRLVTELKACDLQAAARRAVDSYRDRAREKSIEIITVAPDAIEVLADPNLLDQVLANIVSNAVKYSPHGRRVWVVVRVHEGKPRCEVRDEGHGIKPEELGKLFKKFSRLSTKPTGGEQSVGLGLAIVLRMVEAMRGRIWCESIHGAGATFIMEFEKPV